jgi:hypothetical protein
LRQVLDEACLHEAKQLKETSAGSLQMAPVNIQIAKMRQHFSEGRIRHNSMRSPNDFHDTPCAIRLL